MQDRPTAAELLAAAQEFCENDLLPQLSGRVAFHVRVLRNALAILEREWENEGPAVDREWERLRSLLGDESASPSSSHDAITQVRAWNAALAARIRAGDFDDRFDEVLDVLSASVSEKLAIANPRYSRSAAGGPSGG